MRLFHDLYLSGRVFYALSACIFLFFLSFLSDPVFYVALSVLVLLVALLLLDLYLLFSARLIIAERKTASVFSLNDKNKVLLTITNLSSQPVSISVIDEVPFQFNMRDFSAGIQLGGSKTGNVLYSVIPTLRGEYIFGDLHAFVNTRIGLAVKRESTPCKKAVAVYPSIIQMGRQELIALHHPSFIHGGNRNRKLGQSYEFDQIKLYVPGDDTRNINWKASSAIGEIMVNCYEDERSQQIYSIIDKSRVMKMPFNGLTLVDYAINATLAFSNIVLKKQDKAGLIIFSSRIGASLRAERGPRHLKKIMYALYREKYDFSEASYEVLYKTIRKTIPNRSLLFLYTNFDSIYALERHLPALRLINKYHLLVVVFFENTELEAYSASEAANLLDIYQTTVARKFILEKNQIYKELQKHGIQSVKCTPENLSASTINKYLELKSRGLI